MLNKATIVTWRFKVEERIPAGDVLGHIDVFHRADQFKHLNPEDLEKTLIEVELVPTGRKVKDVLK